MSAAYKNTVSPFNFNLEGEFYASIKNLPISRSKRCYQRWHLIRCCSLRLLQCHFINWIDDIINRILVIHFVASYWKWIKIFLVQTFCKMKFSNGLAQFREFNSLPIINGKLEMGIALTTSFIFIRIIFGRMTSHAQCNYQYDYRHCDECYWTDDSKHIHIGWK